MLQFCLPYRSMLTSYCQVMKDSNTATTNKTPRLIKTTQMADIVNNSPVPLLPQELKKAEVSIQSSESLIEMTSSMPKCSKAYSYKYYFIFHSSNLILFCDQMLDQVRSILPALELLPFDCSRRKGEQLQCR